MNDTTQLDAWRGEFGDRYIDRNETLTEVLRMRTRMWAEMLKGTYGAEPESILEVGCNIGLNLRAIDRLSAAALYAVEPNAKARQRVVDDRVMAAERLHDATGQNLPFSVGEIDMVFSAGVLIHVHPDDLGAVADEMHRVSNRWILVAEYFSTKPESIPYRGRNDLLFKRDFGGFFLDRFDDIEIAADGFQWRRSTGLDDVTWVLFRKKNR